ncbi:MAG: Oxidoreductase, short-chain dehydrogenase/reductase family [uncultured Nocardioidaceae bacterium]|uniref:Oxidoreductase, short-chain dehydrogenase/reductase family n=1 Tax=uncultured Nocardioidaceae bacterium TaxID=253824 RepID=A0A6J4MN74_9ACTN|nr:MAG: Oxidoreductase, short-chain dehydrogenase/reductase family [uncultured Nocardioidaceae bacterium]
MSTSRTAEGLAGRVVVITGAASGIGRALAVETAARGGLPAVSDVDEAGLEETAALVAAASGRRPHTHRLDVRDREAWRRYAEAVLAEHGRVDVVVNNAGIALTADVLDMPHDLFARVIDVDFWGVVHGTTTFLPHLVAGGGGMVVNVSSLFGLMAVPSQSAYNAAKFAVRGFTESLRQEMLVAGHPVTVCCVHPGGVRTSIVRNGTVVGIDQEVQADWFDSRLARTTPEAAARAILDGALAGKARVLVGSDAKLLDGLVRLTGSGYQRLVVRVVRRTRPRFLPTRPS